MSEVNVIVTRPFLGICFMQVCAHKDVPHDVREVVRG